MINDAHCHFFSRQFFETLGRQRQAADKSPHTIDHITAELGWNAPGSPEALADAWAHELDRHGVLFGTDSSFFPRGWNAEILQAQLPILEQLELSRPDAAAILGGNLERLVGPEAGSGAA